MRTGTPSCRPGNNKMRSITKPLAASALALALLQPAVSHAFFFFIPLGLFLPNDKKTIDELEQKQDWKGIQDLAEIRLKNNNEKNPSWLYLKGYGLHKQNRFNEAVTQYQLALDAKPDYKEARLNMGICQIEGGNIDAAHATFIEAIAKNPEVWAPYYHMVRIYVKRQDPVTARVYLEQLKTRNMVFAGRVEVSDIQPLEFKLEQDKITATTAAAKAQDDQAQAQRDAQAKQESDAKLLALTNAPKAPTRSISDQLKELKTLRVQGLISKEVYERSQSDILKSR
jgi:tetratricopeptide (TPR) repeat protein